MKVRVRAFGMAGGVSLGLYFSFVTFFSLVFGAGEAFPFLALYLPYLKRTPFGVLYGLVGGFVEGFLIAAFFAWLYNKFHKMFYGSTGAS